MRRWALNLLTGLSLLLCAASVCLWVRTLKRLDLLCRVSASSRTYGVLTSPHRLTLGRNDTAGAILAALAGHSALRSRWSLLSCPYGTPQTLHLEGRTLEAGDSHANIGGITLTVTVHKSPSAGAVPGFVWSNAAPGATAKDISIEIQSVVWTDLRTEGISSDLGSPPAAAVAAPPVVSPPNPVSWDLTMPLWLLVAVTGVLPVGRSVWRCSRWWRRHRRHRLGLCQSCGYDLRASPQRCPECGTPVSPDLSRKPMA